MAKYLICMYLHPNQTTSLVEQLYTLRDPDQLAVVQRQLQDLQKGPDGWIMARDLLHSDNLQCKFFGALTYTVRLNLDDSHLAEACWEMVQAMVLLVRGPTQAGFVVRKLMLNLVLVFLKEGGRWQDPLRCVAWALSAESISQQELEQHMLQNDLAELDPQLPHTPTLLTLAQILVEDTCKYPRHSPAALHTTIHTHVRPQVQAMLVGVWRRRAQLPTDTVLASLECARLWVQYSAVAQSESTLRPLLETTFQPLLHVITSSEGEIVPAALQVLLEVVEHLPWVARAEAAAIRSVMFDWGMQYLARADADDANEYVQLVVAFVELDIHGLATSLAVTPMLQPLLSMTAAPAFSPVLVDLWALLADALIDDTEALHERLARSPERIAAMDQAALALCGRLVQVYLPQIHFQPGDEFGLFRRDVADLVEMIHQLVRFPVYRHLTEQVDRAVALGSARDAEAALFLLQHILDSFSDTHLSDESQGAVAHLIQGGLFEFVSAQGVSYLTATTLRWVSSVSVVLKLPAGDALLAPVLGFLFSAVALPSHLLALKTLASVADDTRVKLARYLPQFQELVNRVMDPTTHLLVRERIVHSWALVVQAIKDPAAQGPAVAAGVEALATAASTAPSPEYLLLVLKCLLETGRGMRVPEEAEDWFTPQELDATTAYWNEDPLGFHSTVWALVNQFCSVAWPEELATEAVETACAVPKTGLGESVPGAFAVAPKEVLLFLQGQADRPVAQLAPLFSLLATTVSTHHRELDMADVAATTACLFTPRVTSDPDTADAALMVFTTMAECRPALVLACDISSIVAFAMAALHLPERFLLRRATQWWVKFVAAKRALRQDRDQIDSIMATVGAEMMVTTIAAFLNTTRLNLDLYIDVVRQVMVRYPLLLKQWIEAALEGRAPNASAVLAKLMLTRGQRKLVEVMKDLWLEVNGLIKYR